MALPKRKRLATQAEKNKARLAGDSVPTYVFLDGSPAPSDSGSGSSCSSDSSSSYSSDSGGGGCDSGGSF